MSENIVDLNKEGLPVLIPKNQVCKDCKVEKSMKEFYLARNTKTGYQGYCKECSKRRSKEIQTGERKAGSNIEALTSERQKKIAHMLIENPRASLEEMAQSAGISISTVRGYLSHGRLLKALRSLGSKKITMMIPKALQTAEYLIEQRENLGEAGKMSIKVLESEQILGPNRVDVNITEMSGESSERLRQIIKEAKEFPEQVIEEAQVIE